MIKKNRQAVALHYDGKKAPRVTAKGVGEIAERIIQVAKQHGIPLQENKELTALLAQVQLDSEIPPKLYVAVAQLLAFLYFLNGKTPKDNHS